MSPAGSDTFFKVIAKSGEAHYLRTEDLLLHDNVAHEVGEKLVDPLLYEMEDQALENMDYEDLDASEQSVDLDA
jgi:hypothetical protein